MGKAVRAIAVLQDVFPLNVVQEKADLLRAHVLVVEALDKAGNGALKVDVVFPERVVGVDEEILGSGSHCCSKIYHEAMAARRKPSGRRFALMNADYKKVTFFRYRALFSICVYLRDQRQCFCFLRVSVPPWWILFAAQ